MRRDQHIQVNRLLLEREGLFVRVHDLERAVNDILGEAYPMSQPPLPSNSRTKRKAPPKPRAAKSESAELLRRLEPGEAAYRVTYQQAGRRLTEDHDEWAALKTLWACQSAALQIERIETVDSAGHIAALLFPPPAGPTSG